jgi:hypothetical protein
MTKSGDLVALGCNEVPKYGGGLYWPDDDPDARDFQKGFDPSTRAKVEMLAEIIHILNSIGLLAKGVINDNIDELVDRLL